MILWKNTLPGRKIVHKGHSGSIRLFTEWPPDKYYILISQILHTYNTNTKTVYSSQPWDLHLSLAHNRGKVFRLEFEENTHKHTFKTNINSSLSPVA